MPFPPLTLRADIGGPLTIQQRDDNDRRHEQRIDEILANPPDANGIANVIQPGPTQFKIVLDDATEFTIDLPIAEPVWRGAWTAATTYFAFDLVVVDGVGVYRVLQNHTSAATFDAAESDSDGAFYVLVFGIIIPGVVTISSTTHTPTISASSKYHRCTAVSGCTVTIPKNAAVAFAVGTVLTYEQTGDDPVSIVGDSDSDGSVAVNWPASRAASTAEQYAVVSVVKVATDTWTLIGYLAEAVSA